MYTWIEDPIILEGENVKLLPLEKVHFEELIQLSKEEKIWEFMPIDWLDRKNFQEVLDEAISLRESGQQYPFIIMDKSTNKIIGSTRYLKLNKEFKNLEIGWTWLATKYWGSSYNKECKFLLLKYCFEILEVICVYFGTSETNIRSQKAIESIGAKYEGTLRNRLVWKGIKRSFKMYSITDDDWPEVKSRFEIK